MIRTIIIDDEEKARENLLALVSDYCHEIQVVAKEGNVRDGIAAILELKPDLLFLDVKMQGETGFDLLDQLDQIDFEIIFTTAHDEYALKAFKFSAIDYLLKPINVDELTASVQRTMERVNNKQAKDRFRHLIENFRNSKEGFSKIALPTLEGLTFIQISDIIRCKSSENYSWIFLNNGEKIMVSKTIKYFEDLLSEHNFMRIHRSHLINLEHIKKYIKGEGGYAVMADGAEVMISRRKKDAFLKRFSG